MLGFLFGKRNAPKGTASNKEASADSRPIDPNALIAELNDHGVQLANSRVFDVFNPAKPVSDSEYLAGRQAELRTCLQRLMSPGNHVLLYGDRGVGKSSIGYVICGIFKQIQSFSDYQVYVYRCDSADTLKTIFSAPLSSLGHDIHVREVRASEVSSSETKLARIMHRG